MNYGVFFVGFMVAIIAVMLVMGLRLLIKSSLERWGYDLTRETHSQLRDTNLKLDSIKYQQERSLAALERLERAASNHTNSLNGLHSRLSPLKTAA